MIPVQLTIKGLYSYINSETIDFQPLVAAKLFGIFGPVGSGKSAILEAIMFVLFDRSNRLNKAGDDRYYNMMNLQSNEMVIDFIFKGGRNHKNKYRFYFLARRKAKDFLKVEVRDRSYYQWSKSDWQPLDNSDVLGMSYDNFMQTVIIPQGKFSEFIDQKPTARTQMLKELFHLDRFDIAPQAFRLLGGLREKCNYLEGQLSQYDDINKVLLKQLDKEQEVLNEAIKKKEEKERKLTQEEGRMQLLQHIFTELTELSEYLSVLESETGFYQEKQQQLNRYEKAKDLFRDKILQQKQLLQNAKSKQHALNNLIIAIERMDQAVTKSKQEWNEAQTNYHQKDQLQLQLDDFKIIAELKRAQGNLDLTTTKYLTAEKESQRLEKKAVELNRDNQMARKAAEKKSQILEALQKWNNLLEWWSSHFEKEQHLTLQEKEKLSLEKETKNLLDEINGIRKRIAPTAPLKKKISMAKEELQLLLIHEDWRTHARLLDEGKPCPLCGSLSHPNPLTKKQLTSEVSVIRKKLNDHEKALEVQIGLVQKLNILHAKKKEKDQSLQSLSKKLSSLTDILSNHLRSFPGSGKPQNQAPNIDIKITKLKNDLASIERELTLLNKKLNHEKELRKAQKFADELMQNLALEKEKLEGEINQMIRMVKTLDISEFIKKEPSDIKLLQAQFKTKLNSTESEYARCLKNLNNVEQRLNHQKGLLQSVEIQAKDIEKASLKLETALAASVKKEAFKGLIEVQNILALKLNTERERKEMERYYTDLNVKTERKKVLLKKIGNRTYQESQHQRLVLELDSLKVEVRQLRDLMSSKLHTRDQMKLQLTKKDSVTEDLKEASIRKDHTQEISNLLRGNGFINYISSVYLQNLCKVANVRFTKLTGNQLSLELSEQNEFMVRDFLNDGKLRLLKTLSGGQIFQASLCLALGLAENVKSLNQSEQSFFFLDEGFGSLDRASLQLVFETLKSLQKENRIVGIISHVEELQMEIDTYLSVQQLENKGSAIFRSWEVSN